MRDRPIQVGDLVQVVRPSFCIGGNEGIGVTFIVERIDLDGGSRCSYCDKEHGDGHYYALSVVAKGWWPLRRLKRIPPLSELEGQRPEESLRQPVKEKA